MTTLPDKAQAAKKAEKIGEVIVTFFKDHTHKIEMSGMITGKALRKCQKPLSKMVTRNKIARRRENAAKFMKAEAKAARIAEKAAEKKVGEAKPTKSKEGE
jgi:hypothetical protein